METIQSVLRAISASTPPCMVRMEMKGARPLRVAYSRQGRVVALQLKSSGPLRGAGKPRVMTNVVTILRGDCFLHASCRLLYGLM